MALSQSVQTATHMNSLAFFHALATQEHIDQKILSRLEGLEEAVEFWWGQLPVLRTQRSLVCHGEFQHTCVTPLKALNYSWDAVKHHLQGIWFHSNVSLNLAELQKEIANIGQSQ